MMLKSDDAEIPVTDFLLPNRWGTAAHNLKNHVIVTQLLFMVVYSLLYVNPYFGNPVMM